MQSEAAPSVDLTLNKGVLRDHNGPDVIKAFESDTAVESTKNVVEDATVGKKRNFFGTNARIKPLGAMEEAAPQAVEAISGRAVQPVAAASGGEIQAQPAWSNLPDMVVAMIMTRVKADYLSQMGKKEGDVMGPAHNLGAVCRSWRQIARHTFFSDWWAQGKIVHALQCFSLAPSTLPGLLKCYVQRTQMRNCMRFTAYQGDRPDAVGSRFLMTADVNRFGMTLYLAKGESLPCARVSSNVFCTRYEFIKNHTVGPFDAPWQPAKKHESMCLADVEYRTRIRGCMRPRRMRVLLPDQSVLRKYGPPTAAASAQECGEEGTEADGAQGLSHSSPPGSFNASLTAAATEVAKVSWECSERRQSGGWDSLPSGPAPKPGEWLELENKAPHWNENLKCWCLNFRGRVKFASVKNFQLVDAANPDAIVMQFGKVAFNTYILDFQPGTICAAQAFAIALSAFNKGFSP